MGTDAGNEAREPLKDYRSALAKAKLLALEDSKERTRQRPPGSRRSSSDQKRSRPQTHPASTQGQKHATSIKPPSLHDRSAAAVVKQEPELEVPTLELIPQSSHPAAAPKPNQYAGLVSAKKRKWEEQSPEPGCATVISAARESRALQNRPFAPLKKPVKGPRPPYEDVRSVDTRTTRHSSEWYERIDMKQKYARSDLESLKYLKALIQKCEASAKQDDRDEFQSVVSKLRQRLHQTQFYDFISGVLVKKSKLLEDEGLPSIFSGSSGVQYPWDIRADSLSLYQQWLSGVTDPHLLRGIETKTNRTANGKETKSRRLQKEYQNRFSCNHVGAGGLQNGQWWPLQICAMRDGAHGEIEGGIHGQPGKGAYSVVLSSGGYADVDDGDTLKYCGTPGTDAKPSPGTVYLKDSCKYKTPVRVLRSSALPATNPYRPTKGLRYDGLYNVMEYEILDADTAMHRFTLKRCSGQDPIRYRGVEKRPTVEELAEYSKIRALLGLGA
ncbi:SRA-YDG [Lasallia pustulata]|uniref:SRA-YDG n=1 Tax=Lasallia pustulata TaxID=136370 RepID=A0A1W5D1B6_9LECA|nr:SRA-YDG [Lasallia pustulata]